MFARRHPQKGGEATRTRLCGVEKGNWEATTFDSLVRSPRIEAS